MTRGPQYILRPFSSEDIVAIKERHQNPTVGDTVRLRFFVFNLKNFADVQSVTKIDIYHESPGEAAG